MSLTPIEARAIVLGSDELPLPVAQRHSYRQEQSLSPQRSSWSRSLSSLRGSSRSRLVHDQRAASRERKDTPREVKDSGFLSACDPRPHLPPFLSRFLGWRTPDSGPPYAPLCAFQNRIPRRLEAGFLACLGSFISIVCIESVMIKSGLFRAWGGAPLIVASLGASAVLLFSTLESPLSQPRNAIGGHVLSALTGIIINRLFQLSSAYQVSDPARADSFHHLDWLAAALSMSVALAVMDATGTVHPPGGATALIVSLEDSVVRLRWRFLLVIFASIDIMVGVALLINNVGHSKYPAFWWTAPTPPAPSHEQNQPDQSARSETDNGASNNVELEYRGRPPQPRPAR